MQHVGRGHQHVARGDRGRAAAARQHYRVRLRGAPRAQAAAVPRHGHVQGRRVPHRAVEEGL